MTNITLELADWDKTQKRDRLTGISLNGWCDAVDELNLSTDDEEELLLLLNEAAEKEADRYAYEMRIPRPLLVTTEKPSGTLSQLPTRSQGVHRSPAPFYIRRVRITSSDPLARIMLNLGFRVYPEVGQGPRPYEFEKLPEFDRINVLANASTWVIEFPVKSTTKVNADEEPALDQLDRYIRFQKNWTSHNTSITIKVGDNEWDDLLDEVYRQWDDYVAVSFLPKSISAYDLLPIEPITEVEYITRASEITYNQHEVVEMLTELERTDMSTELLDDGCESGVCPIR